MVPPSWSLRRRSTRTKYFPGSLSFDENHSRTVERGRKTASEIGFGYAACQGCSGVDMVEWVPWIGGALVYWMERALVDFGTGVLDGESFG